MMTTTGRGSSAASFLIGPAQHQVITPQEIRLALQDSKDERKYKGMKQCLRYLNTRQDEAPSLFMTITRFAAASKDHHLKKIIQLYQEYLPEDQSEDDNIPSETLLMSQIVRNELLSANEFVRGARLRNLAKINSRQMLLTVEECIIQNLSHKHPYVRRCAAMCVHAAAQKHGPDVLAAQDELASRCYSETVPSVRKHMILAFTEVAPMQAIDFFVLNAGDSMEFADWQVRLAVLDVIRKVFKLLAFTFPPTPLSQKVSKMITKEVLISKLIAMVEQVDSMTVALEAAQTLLWMSGNNFTHARIACEALVRVLTSETDMNVQVVVLEILSEASRKASGALDHLVLDILRKIAAPSLEIKQTVLDLCLKSITETNVHDALSIIKSELLESNKSSVVKYREDNQKLLLRAMRWLCTNFPSITQSVIELLLDFLTEYESVEVINMVRELMVSHTVDQAIRNSILTRLIESVGDLNRNKALRSCCFLLGEFCNTQKCKNQVIDAIHNAMSPFPLPEPGSDQKENRNGEAKEDEPAREQKFVVRTVVLPDGSYGTENVIEYGGTENETQKISGLRVAITSKASGLLMCVVGMALTKLCIRRFSDSTDPTDSVNTIATNKAILVLGSLIKFCQTSKFFGDNNFATIRLKHCLKAILNCTSEPKPLRRSIAATRELQKILALEREAAEQEEVVGGAKAWEDEKPSRSFYDSDHQQMADVDDPIIFRQADEGSSLLFGPANEEMGRVSVIDYDKSVDVALKGRRDGDDISAEVALVRPAKAVALSGYSDPIYVEVVSQINHHDVIAEIMLTNMTNEMLQNVTVSIGTHGTLTGEMKTLENPKPVNLRPGETTTVSCTIRMSSTEAEMIFGYCSFERDNAVVKDYFNLGELQIDLLDCIRRVWIGQESFRKNWSELEWENKIAIQVPGHDVLEFLSVILSATKTTIVGLSGMEAPDRIDRVKRSSAAMRSVASIINGGLLDKDAVTTKKYVESILTHPVLLDIANRSRVFSVNLCTMSIFGEDAYLNVSLRKDVDKNVTGAIRIRSRTQGIALSLGDRLAQTQRAYAAKLRK